MGRQDRLLRALIAFAFAGCAASGCAPNAPTGESYADLAPRVARSCLACHGAASRRRPSFATLADLRAHAPAMLDAVVSGRMPPGGLDESGACGTFEGPAPFSSDDVAALAAFIDAGMPEGGPVRGAAIVDAAPPRFDRAAEVTLPLDTTTEDAHRCFLVDVGLTAPAFLTGVALQEDAALHHAMVFTLGSPMALAAARALDDASGHSGWSCPGTPGVEGASLVFAWVPGRPVVGFPSRAGVAMPPGPVVVQLHQHGRAEGSRVRLSLLLADDADRAVRVVAVAASGFTLPAAQASARIERTISLPDEGGLVLGVMPHLHRAGRGASLRAQDGPCLVDAPRFDFAFQRVAFYREPPTLRGGERLTLTCTFDTRDRETPTPWGESSDDEMCTVFLFMTGPRGSSPARR